MAVALDTFSGGEVQVLRITPNFGGWDNGGIELLETYSVGSQPLSILSDDFNNDGWLDLATGNNDSATILLNDGVGSFTVLPQQFGSLLNGAGLVAADFDFDGNLDLTSYKETSDGSAGFTTMLGFGDGSFQAEMPLNVGAEPTAIINGDFNNDRILDLVTVNSRSRDVSLLFGRGDGTFRPEIRIPVTVQDNFGNDQDVIGPSATVAAGDFNHDGRLDLAVPTDTNSLAILLGSGDGQFQIQPLLPLGPDGLDGLQTSPYAIAAGRLNDDNGDGVVDDGDLIDLVVTRGDNRLWVLFGKWDTTSGLFDLATPPYVEPAAAVPDLPVRVVLHDLDNDSLLDIAVGVVGDDRVRLLFNDLANPGRNFLVEDRSIAPLGPLWSIAVGRTTAPPPPPGFGGGLGGGAPPVYFPRDVLLVSDESGTILDGDGLVGPPNPGNPSWGQQPTMMLAVLGSQAGDPLTLVVANATGGVGLRTIDRVGDILPGQVKGQGSTTVTMADFNGDGDLDVAIAHALTEDVSVLLGGPIPVPLVKSGGGKSIPPQEPAEPIPFESVLQEPGPSGTSRIRSVPVMADVTGDSLNDILILNRSGHVLLRRGLAGKPGQFSAPTLVNPGYPTSVMTLVRAGAETLVAVATTNANVADLNVPGPKVLLYSCNGMGESSLRNVLLDLLEDPNLTPIPDNLPVRMASGDLIGDSDTFDDLVLVNKDGFITILVNDGQGGFDYAPAPGINGSPAILGVASRAGAPGDVVSAQFRPGSVSIFAFGAELAHDFYSGAGLHLGGLDPASGLVRLRSLDGPLGLVTAQLNDDNGDGTIDEADLLDLVVINNGAHNFAVLFGDPSGGFTNPQVFDLPFAPTAIALGHFNADAFADLAILDGDQGNLAIFAGTAGGAAGAASIQASSSAAGFAPMLDAQGQPVVLDAGFVPSSVVVQDVDDDGVEDLVVGNAFGDILFLIGNGDGTFQPYRRGEQAITLAILDAGTPNERLALGNLAQDQVTVQDPTGTTNTVLLDRFRGLLGPAVQQADLNRDGRADLIVVNSGGNSVDVYFGIVDAISGKPAIDVDSKQTLLVGTNPVSVLVANVNGDINGIPDLIVANQGSNDVSIFFGGGTTTGPDQPIAGWSAVGGPRLNVGTGPESLMLRDLVHTIDVVDPDTFEIRPVTVAGPDGQLDLVVTNKVSNDTYILPPTTGGGFFNDQPGVPLIIAGLSGDILTALGSAGAYFIDALRDTVQFVPDLNNIGQRTVLAGFSGPSGTAGDFNADGLTDALIVNDDGLLQLLLGALDAAEIAGQFDPNLPNGSNIALNGAGAFYVSFINADGLEAARRFVFDLGLFFDTQTDIAELDNSALLFVALAFSGVLDNTYGQNLFPSTGNDQLLTDLLLGVGNSDAGGVVGSGSVGVLGEQFRLVVEAFGRHVADLVETGSILWNGPLGNLWQTTVSYLSAGLDTLAGPAGNPLSMLWNQVAEPAAEALKPAIGALAKVAYSDLDAFFARLLAPGRPAGAPDGADIYFELLPPPQEMPADPLMLRPVDPLGEQNVDAELVGAALKLEEERDWLLTAPAVLAAFLAGGGWAAVRESSRQGREVSGFWGTQQAT